jgi:predicted XRE-type DNA-binding protein
MPRRKLYKISAKDTPIYDIIVSELQKNPELVASYDMTTIEISVKKKIIPHIQDIDKAIDNLKRYMMVNKEFIQVFNGEAMVSKKDIAKMLKISRPTLNKWIKDGFITPVKSKIISNLEIFPPDIILEQLLNQKNRK